MPIIEMSSLHEGLASLLRRLMDVIEADPSIAGIDVNPVVLTPSGSLIALDAVVQRTEPG
jgi:succinyl-CoA synthetase beta subunit